jgi:hypothetical protein
MAHRINLCILRYGSFFAAAIRIRALGAIMRGAQDIREGSSFRLFRSARAKRYAPYDTSAFIRDCRQDRRLPWKLILHQFTKSLQFYTKLNRAFFAE